MHSGQKTDNMFLSDQYQSLKCCFLDFKSKLSQRKPQSQSQRTMTRMIYNDDQFSSQPRTTAGSKKCSQHKSDN